MDIHSQDKISIMSDIFSRRVFNLINIFLIVPFYILFLIGIRVGLLTLSPQPIARIIVLGSAPIILLALYLTSKRKIFNQRTRDIVLLIGWMLISAAGNTYWGGPLRVNGPLFLGYLLLIPFSTLLLDSFLPFFIAFTGSFLLIIEFILTTDNFSVLSTIDILFNGIVLIISAIVSSGLVKRILKEKDMRRELLEAYEDLKRLDKAKSEFVSIASHQLRTPLTAVKGYISMILEGTYGKFPEKAEKPLENISQSNDRLIKLVNDLLNVSRIEAGRLEIKYEKADVGEVVKSVFEELKNESENKKLYLKLERSEEKLPEISIDKDKIRQVILNLIDNAIRYTEKGGITVGLRVLGYNLQIAISDTGEGMNKEEIEKMFTSFSRGSAGTKLYTEGAGLGLYVAKKFVDMHSGRIWAESKGKGKGTTFYIELPIK